MHAEHPARLSLRNDLGDTSGIPVDDGSGNLGERENLALTGEPPFICLLFGHPDRRDRRRGEGHPGEGAVVDAPVRACDCVVSDDAPVLSRDVDELRMAGDITRGEDARVGGAKLVVHDDFAT